MKMKRVECEVVDWDQYWVLDYEGNEKPYDGSGYVYDKEEYPNLKNAQDAFHRWVAEKKAEREAMTAKTKEYRRLQRAARKAKDG
jgi:hypothetical protein